MKLISPEFDNDSTLPIKYTCDGEGINPPLIIKDVPEGTQSLVLIVKDPDAPAGIFIHWLIWNIDPKTAQISENSTPINSIEGVTSSKKPGYAPPCPPNSTHRYIFTLYALDILLDLNPDADENVLNKAINGHVIDKNELIGLYSRQS